MRMMNVNRVVLGVVVLLLVCGSNGDLYMQYMRGSNNKLNEPSNTRRNGNRLFDSQNNDNAGYNVGDNCIPACSDPDTNTYDKYAVGAGNGVMYYYTGSVVTIEWTAQHGCGNPNTNCEIILQYMCEGYDNDHDHANNPDTPGIRDGHTTDTIPFNTADAINPEYGRHEPYYYYSNCTTRSRNGGLFSADQLTPQQLQVNLPATFTRQNSNGQRFGYECPEERDYYPYWHPSPWRDIAVIVDDVTRCGYYQRESQNVQAKGYCSVANYNNPYDCATHGGHWSSTSWGIGAPDCVQTVWSRDNHHGNTMEGFMANYNWTIPDTPSNKCAFRMRYNMSTNDYPDWGDNMLTGAKNNANSPIKDKPASDWVGLGENVTGPLRLSINSDQFGRTFQDRSHVFRIESRPSSISHKAKIYNIGVRGRRGNIQQVYPAVEYDFVPNTLSIKKGDYVHFQWTGADSNPAGNAGEGRAMTDRSNLVEVADLNLNFPLKYEQTSLFGGNKDTIAKFAFLGQTGCDVDSTDNDADDNCKLLNAASAYFDGGLLKIDSPGTHHYLSTRNHQYSNRSQKGTLIVIDTSLTPGEIGAIVVGVVLGVGCASAIGLYALARHAKLNPDGKLAKSRVGKFLAKQSAKVSPFETASLVSDGSSNLTGAENANVPNNNGVIIAAAGNSGPAKPLKKTSRIKEIWSREKYRIIFLVGFSVVEIAIFFYGFLSNLKGPSIYFTMAKGGGSLLNFNCSLILFPVLRNMISFLRLTPLSEIIPLDDNLSFHKIIAGFIAFATLIHIIGHYLNFRILYVHFNQSIAGNAIGSFEGLTGHIILLAMVIIFVTAVGPLKRKTFKFGKTKIGGYDVFWFCHKFYIVFLLFLWIHGPRFFMWSVYPTALFLMEKAIRKYRSKETTEIVRIIRKASDVICIQMRKRDFKYKAGQYVYLNCPSISSNEWHPFTITSSPLEDVFSVHIRCKGDWTIALSKYLNPDSLDSIDYEPTFTPTNKPILISEEKESSDSKSVEQRKSGNVKVKPSEKKEDPKNKKAKDAKKFNDSEKATSSAPSLTLVDASEEANINASTEKLSTQIKIQNRPVINTDGPYGSASEHVFDYDVVMLIGAGIGVTPFASIMKTISLRQQQARFFQNMVAKGGVSPGSVPLMQDVRPKKVYFYWVCGDEQEFNWFKYLLNDIEQDQDLAERFSLNTFLTGEVNLEEMVNKLATTSTKGKESRSNPISSGLNMKYAGRPNWRRIFKEHQKKHPQDEIGVFLCGPITLANELSDYCAQNSTINGTRFTFRKENF
eukprot:TRINITY_DN4157_c0_g1_i4.p1 TRINITY_DN4157_c0_g1~~TRINITY_DN4157_c0_g1_i4.p1  ORF type:complete len:1284 (+),score=241.55 TRINITY_DN4157_c0_g1_i4:155-4006(+)